MLLFVHKSKILSQEIIHPFFIQEKKINRLFGPNSRYFDYFCSMMGKLCGILTCLLIQLPCLLSATTYQRSQFVELSAANITSNVKDWEVDLAVMFYAPWCKYCKQLAPSMARMAELQESKKELVFGKYNCEQSDTDVKLCRALGITQYPSVYFFGFGNFNQAPKGNIFGRSDFSRMVKYTADLIPEAIYDWILMLQSIR